MAQKLRKIMDGIHFGEGPRWHQGRLWFSDFYARCVRSVGAQGDVRIELTLDDDAPSGLGWMPDGSLLIVAMNSLSVLRRWPDGRITTHADLSALSAHKCNDMVVDAQGRAYVGNFGFALDEHLRARGVESVVADHPSTNLVRVDADGSVHLAADDMHFPNGSVITPDGKTLIVGETLAGRLTAFDIAADGALSNRREWASTWPRVPDGIALDAEGAIWIANPIAPECVRIAQGGAVLEVISLPMPCYACMLGGDDGRSLYMLIAPTSDGDECARAPQGELWAAQVDHPRAGLP